MAQRVVGQVAVLHAGGDLLDDGAVQVEAREPGAPADELLGLGAVAHAHLEHPAAGHADLVEARGHVAQGAVALLVGPLVGGETFGPGFGQQVCTRVRLLQPDDGGWLHGPSRYR